MMTVLALAVAFAGGVLTVTSPCIVPVLPFVLSRGGRPFGQGALPLLLGAAATWSVAVSLAAWGGAWAAEAAGAGRWAALAVLALMGLSMLAPLATARIAAPLNRAAQSLQERIEGRSGALPPALASFGIGVATGLVWTPCAGPILGLILSASAAAETGVATPVLLLAYAAGAGAALGAVVLVGRRAAKPAWRSGGLVHRGVGFFAVVSAALIALQLHTPLLANLPAGPSAKLEQKLLDAWRMPSLPMGEAAAAEPSWPFPSLASLRGAQNLPALDGATGWINTPPLTPQDLRGKVVLVDFWTYSCINCIRMLPHLRAWADKYKDEGLVLLSVHSPEFAFEKDRANVEKAVRDHRIKYPVLVDSNHAVWRAFGNQYWPALYFVDAQGRVRESMFGEGNYAQAEQLIQKLLAENGKPVARGLVSPPATGAEALPSGIAGSQETYLGSDRASGFVSAGRTPEGDAVNYRMKAGLRVDQWTLDGAWRVESELAQAAKPGAKLALRFRARDLHLVMGPSPGAGPVRFRVLVDGKPPADAKGADIDAQGNGRIEGHRLYQLVRQPAGAAERTFEIEFLDPGARAYAFTFG